VFFEKFSATFDVDLSSFVVRKYFEREGSGLINLAWLFGKRRAVKRSVHEISIGDLVNTVKLGKWSEP
jgi:hypothetical protein